MKELRELELEEAKLRQKYEFYVYTEKIEFFDFIKYLTQILNEVGEERTSVGLPMRLSLNVNNGVPELKFWNGYTMKVVTYNSNSNDKEFIETVILHWRECKDEMEEETKKMARYYLNEKKKRLQKNIEKMKKALEGGL